MKKTDRLRKLQTDYKNAFERLGAARRDRSLTEYLRGTKVDMIRKEMEIIRAEIKKLNS